MSIKNKYVVIFVLEVVFLYLKKVSFLKMILKIGICS